MDLPLLSVEIFFKCLRLVEEVYPRILTYLGMLIVMEHAVSAVLEVDGKDAGKETHSSSSTTGSRVVASYFVCK